MKNFNQREILLSLLLIFTIHLNANTTRANIKLLEASEEIKFISQKIVKEYFYLNLNGYNKEFIFNTLQKMISDLNMELELITSNTKSEDAKKLLTFLAYNTEQMKDILSNTYNLDNSSLLIDYSEILLESAISIEEEHTYLFSEKEKMLINIKEIKYIMERVAKYYLIYQSGFNDNNDTEQLKISINNLNTKLKIISRYKYPKKYKRYLNSFNNHWNIAKELYLTLEIRELSNIMHILETNLKDILSKLELYHSKNQ